MRSILLLLCGVVVASGCTTTLALKRRTVNQSLSVADARYREVLDNLAVVAANPGTVPSFATLSGGMVNMSNNYGLDSHTNWTASAFMSQAMTLSGSHVPDQQWTVEPVAEATVLTAVHYACLWGVYGAPEPGSPTAELLRPVRRNDDDQPHFGVDHWLKSLPPGWLNVGCCGDVPASAAYHAHCGATYVWVCPENLPALSNFTLAILDLATTDFDSVTWQPPMAAIEIETAVGKADSNSPASPSGCKPHDKVIEEIPEGTVESTGLEESDEVLPAPDGPWEQFSDGESEAGPCLVCPQKPDGTLGCPCPGEGQCYVPGPTPAGGMTTKTKVTVQQQICQDATTGEISIPSVDLPTTGAPTFCFCPKSATSAAEPLRMTPRQAFEAAPSASGQPERSTRKSIRSQSQQRSLNMP